MTLRALAAVVFLCTAAHAAGDFEWRLPRGFPEPAVPQDNPMSAAKVALGARLFADRRLSVTGDYSCESCHSPSRAFTDGRALSRGATGETLPLNAPTLLNAAYNASLGWRDPEVRTLEQQMRGPLFDPRELGLAGRETEVVELLARDSALAAEFAAAFPADPAPVSMDNVIRAIAAYERTLLSANSAFDRYVFRGDHAALDESQKRGMALFFSARTGCAGCHAGINFAGEWIDRDHPGAKPAFADTGTGGKMRVPTLRNLARTAPYMHDGRFARLDEVLRHYEKLAAESADARLARAPLTTEEQDALRDFLVSLDDD
jgi:cytochrome c peroxidase